MAELTGQALANALKKINPGGTFASQQAILQQSGTVYNPSAITPNTSITPAGLTPPTSTIPITTTAPTVVDANILTASTIAQQNLDKQTAADKKAAEAELVKKQTAVTSLETIIGTLGEDLATKGSEQLEAEKAAGISAMTTDKANIDAQVLTGLAEYNQLKTEYDKVSLENRNKPITMNSIIGAEAAIDFTRSQKLNSKAADIGLLQAQSLGKAGQIEASQKAVDRAIDLKYSDKEALLKTKTQQLTALYTNLTKSEKIVADVLTRQYESQQKSIDDQKAQEKTNFTEGQAWAKLALTAGQSELASKISSLDISSPTYTNDLAELQAQIKTKPTGFTGFTGSEVVAIKDDIATYGVDKVLEGVTDPKEVEAIQGLVKTAIKKVTKEYLEKTITQKMAIGDGTEENPGLRGTYTDEELSELARENGFAAFFTGKKGEVENFLNSDKAKELYVNLLYEQYELAGMTK